MKRKLLIALFRIILTVALFIVGLWIYIAQPTFRSSAPVERTVDSKRLEAVVKKLSVDFYPRSYADPENLNECASYIAGEFRETSGEVTEQIFTVYGKEYRNISCLFDSPNEERIVIGAHYDSHDDTPGADDNASGVAGLIELAHLLNGQPLSIDVELVAYSLEEPPFFSTEHMGSYHHARKLHENGIEVRGMIALEMIGYFSEELFSQSYPVPVLRLLYPARGNFIGVIGNLDQRSLAKTVKIGMKGATNLPVYSMNAPGLVPGIDFSDHRNYWEFGYPAVMISDTAFYRNLEYHELGDTWERLDYEKMGKVVLGVYSVIQSLESELREGSR